MVLKFTVVNMKCAGCVKAIQEGLAQMEGVRRAEAALDDGTVRVEGEGLDQARIAAALNKLGYPVASS